jgi:lysophospholipase L1-like esterase
MGSRLGSLALAAAAVLATLIVAEGVLRLRAPIGLPHRRPPERPEALRGLPEIKGVLALMRPNVRGVFRRTLYRTNSLGVRGPEYSAEPEPGVFRIVVVGDSYTMGFGVEEDEAYVSVAQRLFSERRLGRRVEIINLGIGGLAIGLIMKRLEGIGLAYRPHLVVYGFTPNDIEGPGYIEATPEEKADFKRRVNRFASSPSLLLRNLWPRLLLARSALWPVPGSYEHVLEQNYFRNPEAARNISLGLDRLAQLTRYAGVCGLVFVHTRMNQLSIHPFTRIYRHVAGLARERGLSAHVSLPTFRGRNAMSLRNSALDDHPNPEGHRLHAEALLAGLEALPAHCWQPGHYLPSAASAPSTRSWARLGWQGSGASPAGGS